MKLIRFAFFMVCTANILFGGYCYAQDSTSINTTKKNRIEIEFLANGYWSPYANSGVSIFPFSLTYSRMAMLHRSCWQFSVGIGGTRSEYSEKINNQFFAHHVLILSTPLGFLMRPFYKRNGLWVGFFYCPAFGRQQYNYYPNSHSGTRIDLNFDYEIMPNLCYQFSSKKEGFSCKLLFTPKFTSALSSDRVGYKWKVYPLWGGISIGGAW